ncbi:succinate dehydrogenase, hydrophobic membrane anchor protein [Aurantiacibacter sediminis]|uniref:Succinate dehydrogenase hydrophobic membrane anchor subunit n=1 Tax=Aurantiacibacter sediminis TaxID=2793064 RepID=A0ABS0N366_9SPHN|nr:succinate dehydrogenase, hydrophobic membrane anchor protein [Aurantiacibacter sediminis]MBH5322402.1 succinate dehydrogenase, hydrophobic membrane anchor protein [Aurantiacibacter sediminis]
MGNGTSIGRVRGLGSAHEGPHHWLVQRFTAVGNLVTVLFLGISLFMLPNLSYETVSGWIAEPVPAFMVALLIITTFWHARLGLQVLIEDYVHESGSKFAALLILNLLTFAGAGFGLFCVARLAFGAGVA